MRPFGEYPKSKTVRVLPKADNIILMWSWVCATDTQQGLFLWDEGMSIYFLIYLINGTTIKYFLVDHYFGYISYSLYSIVDETFIFNTVIKKNCIKSIFKKRRYIEKIYSICSIVIESFCHFDTFHSNRVIFLLSKSQHIFPHPLYTLLLYFLFIPLPFSFSTLLFHYLA